MHNQKSLVLIAVVLGRALACDGARLMMRKVVLEPLAPHVALFQGGVGYLGGGSWISKAP